MDEIVINFERDKRISVYLKVVQINRDRNKILSFLRDNNKLQEGSTILSMRRQFRLSISPIAHRSNLDYSISLKYGYVRSKEHLIQKLRFHNPPNDAPIRKKPIVPRKKKTISIMDFNSVLEERIKLPPISNEKQSELRTSQSALIKDIFSFPASKVSHINIKIPQTVVNTLSKRKMDWRWREPESCRRYVSSMPRLQKDIPQGETLSCMKIDRSKKKRKHRSQFDIEPWEVQSQMGNTENNFNPQRK